MDTVRIILDIFGIIGGVTGIIALYKAKPEKTALEIENLKEVIEVAQAERDEIKEEMINLKDRMVVFERAFNSAFRCRFFETFEDCPVIKTYKAHEGKKQ